MGDSTAVTLRGGQSKGNSCPEFATRGFCLRALWLNKLPALIKHSPLSTCKQTKMTGVGARTQAELSFQSILTLTFLWRLARRLPAPV